MLGGVLAGMNAAFYLAIDRIPLGVASTIEFAGPLALALLGSRRRLDLVWAALALGGVLLFAGDPGDALDRVGLLLAAVSTGRLALAMAVAAVVQLPTGGGGAAHALLSPGLVAAAVAVAVLTGALPMALELASLRHLTTAAYGILVSLEPAIAAVVGAVALGQRPRTFEALAVLMVVVASVGAVRTGRGDRR